MAFKISSVEHFLALVVHDVKIGAQKTDAFLQKEEPKILNGMQLGAAIASAVDPGAAPTIAVVERASEYSLGKLLGAVATADAAAEQNGLSVTLDAQEVQDFKAFLATLTPAIMAKIGTQTIKAA
jgi:hypothetical protein